MILMVSHVWIPTNKEDFVTIMIMRQSDMKIMVLSEGKM